MAPPPVIRLHPEDSVVIARATLLPGVAVAEGVAAIERVPAGHKVAVRPIAPGEPVRRYGQIIGFATAAIAPGQHVHVHNCGMGDFAKDYAYGVDARPTAYFDTPATFQGFRRADGRVATRNYIGIVTSVNCSAHVAGLIADAFRRNPFGGADPLADYPNVDGVVALTHKTGCGMTEGEPLRLLRRTLAGYARHVNFSHVVALGLGCEVNQIGGLLAEQRLAGRLRSMDIQALGGTRKTVEAGVAFVREVLAEANAVRRETVPAAELTVALQCGGSDGYSGVSANPALGAASDLLVRHGGTVILSETPETYGAEHLLTRRAVSREVGEKLVALMRWWEEVHGAGGGGDERQSLAGEQGGRADDHPGEVAGGDGEGGQHQPGRCGGVCGGGGRARVRVHGYARLRSGGGDRAGGGGCEPGVLHDRTGERVRVQAGAFHQAGDELGDVPADGRRYGRELRDGAGRGRERAGVRGAGVRADAAGGFGGTDEERRVRVRGG